MSVLLIRNYGSFATGTTVTLDSDTESALVAQGYATAIANSPQASSRVGAPDMYVTVGGVTTDMQQSGQGAPATTAYQGPLFCTNIALGSAALTTYETNGVAQVAGTINYCDIYVPFPQTWTGIGILNGTTVGTHNLLVALYGSNGVLLAQSAAAGVLSANASVMQNVPFTSPIPLPPGRYFLASQFSGTTPTPRHILAANGSSWITGTQAGVFGTVPNITTVATTFTTATGNIAQLYV